MAVIFAAGEAKAETVANAIENLPHVLYPATCLQKLENVRFYLTVGAASRLRARQIEALARSEAITPTQIEKVLVDLSLSTRKRIADLASSDVNANPSAKILLEKSGLNLEDLKESTAEGLKAKIQAGVSTKRTRFSGTQNPTMTT